MDIDQRRSREESHMRSAQDGLEVMRCQGGAEENEQDREGRCGQERRQS